MSQAKPEHGDGIHGADAANHRRIVAGAAVGIGSAAIVAALLFANRGKPQKPPSFEQR